MLKNSEFTIGLFLRLELELRSQRNQAYSLRAFARDLDISPGFLSQLISGSRKSSPEKIDFLSRKLQLNGSRKMLFDKIAKLERILHVKLDVEAKELKR